MSTITDALAAWDRDGERPICVKIPPIDMVGDMIRDQELLYCFLYLQSFAPCLRLPSLLDEPIRIHEDLFKTTAREVAHGIRDDVPDREMLVWGKMIAVLRKWRDELEATAVPRIRLVS